MRLGEPLSVLPAEPRWLRPRLLPRARGCCCGSSRLCAEPPNSCRALAPGLAHPVPPGATRCHSPAGTRAARGQQLPPRLAAQRCCPVFFSLLLLQTFKGLLEVA